MSRVLEELLAGLCFCSSWTAYDTFMFSFQFGVTVNKEN